jgi:hypothetical protein
VLDGPAPEIDGERTTGVTLSPEARDLRYLYAIDALRHEVAEVRRSTWPLVAREVVVQLASVAREVVSVEVWPGRLPVRVSTVILLGILGTILGTDAVLAWLGRLVAVAP